ncbi:hypothetical protein B566_EDAN001590 [Ephemera danica]|nr:hypothetical protein B566_EDAN001590 [Ephemera danica]
MACNEKGTKIVPDLNYGANSEALGGTISVLSLSLILISFKRNEENVTNLEDASSVVRIVHDGHAMRLSSGAYKGHCNKVLTKGCTCHIASPSLFSSLKIHLG